MGAAVDALIARLDTTDDHFRDAPDAGLPRGHGGRSRAVMHSLLARMQACFDEGFGDVNFYQHYEIKSASRGYSIEHVLPRDPGPLADRFADLGQYQKLRNRAAALVLIRAVDNQTLGDAEYPIKRPKYREMSKLVRTLHEDFYVPEVKAVLEALDLPFKPYESFGPEEIEERQEAYLRLAELTWHPRRVRFAARPQAPESGRVFGIE